MGERPVVAARAVAPGRIVKRELEARGWTQKNLAEILGRPEQVVSEIVRGRKQITPDTALQLSEAFGTSAAFWINLEGQYRLHLARSGHEEALVARRSRLYSLAPVSELIQRGWIRKTDSIDELEQGVCGFLQIESPDQQPTLAVSLRQTQTREPEVQAEIAWAKRVQHLAEAQDVGAPFDRNQVTAALPELLQYTAEAKHAGRVPPLLQSWGIHFVIVPHLSHTYLDGAAFTTGEHPIVALTLRYDRIDNFWFTLLHEMAHILAGHPGIYLDDLETLGDNELEVEANKLAQDWLIDPEALDRFVRLTRPYFSGEKIVAFARQQGRHRGIVLGRLHYEDEVPHKNLRGWLVKVSPHLKKWIDMPGPS